MRGDRYIIRIWGTPKAGVVESRVADGMRRKIWGWRVSGCDCVVWGGVWGLGNAEWGVDGPG